MIMTIASSTSVKPASREERGRKTCIPLLFLILLFYNIFRRLPTLFLNPWRSLAEALPAGFFLTAGRVNFNA
jgi:hypothetical protein